MSEREKIVTAEGEDVLSASMLDWECPHCQELNNNLFYTPEKLTAGQRQAVLKEITCSHCGGESKLAAIIRLVAGDDKEAKDA